MGKHEESKHKEKRHKRDKDRDVDRGTHIRRERVVDLEESTNGIRSDRLPIDSPEHREEKEQELEEKVAIKQSSIKQARTEEANGEVSLSVEETNRVRLSLGLKPLQLDGGKDADKAAKAAHAEKQKLAKKAEEAAVAERIKEQKERRLEQEKLRKTKTLGEAGEDVDNLSVWLQRSRTAEQKQKDDDRAKAAKLAKQLEEQDDIESDEEIVTNPQELAGMKVKHSADELKEGETMLLTLADRSILDESGNIAEEAEELENALVTEDKLRRRALKAATKENKPLFGEDGRVQGLLEKYDEEAEEEGMQIDSAGVISAAKQKQQEEIRARLRAAESAASGPGPSFNQRGDFYTQEEMAQFQKPRAKKKRKLRKKDGADGESLNVAALEAEAVASGESRDRGSRAERAGREAQQAAEQAALLQERQDRYQNALNKANIASLALQRQAVEEPAEEEEADEDLQASLARARRAAQQKAEAGPSADEVAVEATRRREEKERHELEQGGGLEFSEAKDFANSIQLVKIEEPAGAEEPPEMHEVKEEEMEEEPPAPTPLPPPPAKPEVASGGWVSADKARVEPMEVEAPVVVKQVVKKDEKAPESMVREKTVGVGLAGAMALLRERGELQNTVEWAGRNNDMRKDKLEGLGDVYRGGQHEDKTAANIEQALTERDEFGRVLTPKERFRQLCHNFHGKTISKGKQEKRLRKVQEQIDAKRAATGEGGGAAFARLGAQQMAGTPYMVLSGKVQPGQSSDPASGFATVDRHAAPTPVHGGATPKLGGGETPLMGDRKVEIMLGLKREKPSGSRMLPPPPKAVRK